MTEKKAEMSQAMKEKLAPKQFVKTPINGTKFTVLVSSAKGGVGKSTFATNLALALKKIGCKVYEINSKNVFKAMFRITPLVKKIYNDMIENSMLFVFNINWI